MLLVPSVLSLALFAALPRSNTSQGASAQSPGWSQWGGDGRNFRFDGSLASEWPEEGPPQLWSRPLGDGYSTIVVDGDRLYTLYRKSLDDGYEYVVCIDATDGKTVWEFELAAPLPENPDPSGWAGFGPNSTPLVEGDRLYAIGSRGALLCLDKLKGELLWDRDLHGEFHAGNTDESSPLGFAPSPLVYKDTLIIAAGCEQRRKHRDEGDGPDKALLVFNLKDGELAWSNFSFEQGGASPLLVHCLGRDQLFLSTKDGLLGVDPADGTLLWSYEQLGGEVTPVWDGGDLIFYSGAGNTGQGLVVQLEEVDGGIVANRRWGPSRNVLIWQPTPVCEDGALYGTTDDELLCVDMYSGECLWREDGFPVATCLRGADKMILLDQDGWLTLATAQPDAFEVHSRVQIAERYCFSAPSLVGTTLYLRDRKTIRALNLGRS